MKKTLMLLISILFASLTFAQSNSYDEYLEYYQYYQEVMRSSNKYLFSSSSEAQQAVANLEVMKKYYVSNYSYFMQEAKKSSMEMYNRYMSIANDFNQKSKYCHNWIIKAKTQVELLRMAGY